MRIKYISLFFLLANYLVMQASPTDVKHAPSTQKAYERKLGIIATSSMASGLALLLVRLKADSALAHVRNAISVLCLGVGMSLTGTLFARNIVKNAYTNISGEKVEHITTTNIINCFDHNVPAALVFSFLALRCFQYLKSPLIYLMRHANNQGNFNILDHG